MEQTEISKLDRAMGFQSVEERRRAFSDWSEGVTPQPVKELFPAFVQKGEVLLGAITVPVRTAMTAVASRFSTAAKSDPAVVDVVAKRIGVAGPNLAQKVVQAVKDNKLTAALVAYELGDVAVDLYKTLSKDDDVKAMADRYDLKSFDPSLSSDSRHALIEQADEMRLIADAARVVGGYDRLLTLRQALFGLDEGHFRTYDAVRTLSRVV